MESLGQHSIHSVSNAQPNAGLPVISLTAAEGREGDSIVFRVTMSAPSIVDVTVQARTVRDGTADFGPHDADSSGRNFTITIPAGQTVADVSYSPSGIYSTDEFDENFSFELSDPVNAVLAGGGPLLSATGVVLDGNGGQNRALFVSDPVILETDGNGQQAVFEIRLSQPYSQDITLDYQTANGTGTAGTDYVAAAGSVTFLAGQTVASVAVDIIGDTVAELTETFSLVVETSAAIANGVADASGVATILDEDTTSGLPVVSVTATEGLEGDNIVFRVVMSEPSIVDVTVQARTVRDGTADFGPHDADASGQMFTILIPAGETVSAVSYSPSGIYSTDEFDENYALELSNPVNAVLAGGAPVISATGVVLDGNGGQNRALFVSDPVILETDGNGQQAVFEIRLSQPFSQDITLDYQTADGTGTAGADYVATAGSVTFLAGQTVASVAVDIIGDTVAELTETFSLVVETSAAIANGVADASGVATILDEDTTSGLPVISVTATEGLEGDNIVFRVVMSEPSIVDVTVQARTVRDGTADFGPHDADAGGGFTITIPAGQTVATVSYSPSGIYSTDEFDENFTLSLSDPVNAVLAGGGPVLTATGVVLDGNGGQNRALFVSDPIVLETEGNGQQAVFEIRLSQPFTQDITLNYQTADGTGTAGDDYVATSGSVTFLAGQTVASVAVDIVGDTVAELTETFSLVVETSIAISNGVADASGVATILDDDTTTDLPVISLTAAEGLEGDRVVFRVILSEPSIRDITVQARVVNDGSADFGPHDADTSGSSFTLTIPAGETVWGVTYSPSGIYSSDELDENFTLELSNPVNAVLAGGEPVLSATGVVLDANGGQNWALFVSDPVIFETDGSGQQAVFEVRLSQPFSQDMTFDYQTADGTATAGADYIANSGSVTFLAGQTVASVAVDIVGDYVSELQETFSLIFESALGINGSLDLTGVATIISDDEQPKVIVGTSAPDLLVSSDFGDTVQGLGGADTLIGNDGDDVLIGGSGGDSLNGGNGDDLLIGGEPNNLSNAAEADIFVGGAGQDTVSYEGSFGSLRIDLQFPSINTFAGAGDSYDGIEHIIGSQGADNIRGNQEANELTGLANVDYIFGRRGDDTLEGGVGDDVLFGGVGADRLIGGVNRDRAQYSEALTALLVDLGNASQNTGEAAGDVYSSIEDLAGSSFDDTLFGNGGDNRLFGREGRDQLLGRSGNDTLNGGGNNDTLDGGLGDDVMRGGDSEDTFVFNGGSDIVEDYNYDILSFDRGLFGGADLNAFQIRDFASVIDGDTVFDFGAGNTLTLLNTVFVSTALIEDF